MQLVRYTYNRHTHVLEAPILRPQKYRAIGKLLQPGDTARVEFDGIGHIGNRIVQGA